MSALSDILREARVRQKKTLRQVAQSAGVSAMYISQIENEERIPIESKVLPTIALALGLDPKTVLTAAFQARSQKAHEKLDSNDYILIARKIREASPEILEKVNALLDGKKEECE